MDRDPVAQPLAAWLGLGLRRQQRRLLCFFGFLVTAWYSYLIVAAVDRMGATSPPAAFFSAEHEQLMRYYAVWTMGLLAMLLPAMFPNSPRLLGMAAMAMHQPAASLALLRA